MGKARALEAGEGAEICIRVAVSSRRLALEMRLVALPWSVAKLSAKSAASLTASCPLDGSEP